TARTRRRPAAPRTRSASPGTASPARWRERAPPALRIRRRTRRRKGPARALLQRGKSCDSPGAPHAEQQLVAAKAALARALPAAEPVGAELVRVAQREAQAGERDH